MKLQKILSNFQKLHPKEIDLSLDRIKNLCEKLGNPQNKIKAISIVGTNGKNSTIQAAYSILKEANFECNVYTSPHIQKINERFIFSNQELNDDELADLLEEVEKINNNHPITVFEMLSACFFYKAAQYPDNINLIESGLFEIAYKHKYIISSRDKKKFKSNSVSLTLFKKIEFKKEYPENI